MWQNGQPTTYGRPDIINYHDDHFTTPPETNWPHGIKCRPVKNIRRRSIVAPYQDQIVVEGCGTTELNGIYKCSDMHGGAPEYTRTGDWKGREATYVIFREYPHRTKRYKPRVYSWCIGRSTVTGRTSYNMIMFKSQHNASNCMIPPESGWSIVGRTRGGVYPAPKCRPSSTGNVINFSQPQQFAKTWSRLTPEGKVALREAVLSAIRHPQGTVDPECLKGAMVHLPENAILNAARLGRQHDERNREQTRQQQGCTK